jgi:3-hydroxyacyl-[acyl-carrier-protein] dehydratase
VKDVKDYIPHRDPFLFVDRILELEEDKIVCEFTLKEDLDVFRGHYPGQPIMPGVLLSEAVFQTAGVFMSAKSQSDSAEEGKVPLLTKINGARFRKMALPGETIRMVVTPKEVSGPFHIMRGKVLGKDDALIMNVEFVVTLK